MAQNETDLVGLLIEHVGDLEAAVFHITAEFDPVLWKTAGEVMSTEAEARNAAGNFDPESDQNLWIMPADWATDPAHETSYKEDGWFAFHVSEAGEGEGVTSLAAFLGVGAPDAGMVLSFAQDMLKGRKWKSVLAQNEEAVQSIRDAGFNVEQREGRIEMPVALVRGSLADALREENAAAAFGPLRDALKKAFAAKPHFDSLVKAARIVAYG